MWFPFQRGTHKAEAATKRVLVTGATGFVGRHVVRALVEKGVPVRAVAHTHGHEHVIDAEGVEACYADVTDAESLKATMGGVDGVVHLVAIIREGGRSTFEGVNHQGTNYVAAAAREAGVRCFVHLSAIGARDDPEFSYLQSKWKGEQAVVRSGVPYTILRGSVIFGEGDGFINTLAGVVKAFPLVPVAGNGQARFQPLHVQDLAQCIVQTLEREELRGQTIEVGGPTHLTYNEIVATISRAYGLRYWSIHLPLPVMRGLVGVMEKVLPHPPATLHQLIMLALDNIAEVDTVEQVFGFAPRPLKGNIGYINRISFLDALGISMGFMPRRIRDH
ncbi:complex I NDUFA9 subunit family protein [Chloroflexota bacterium]